MAGLGEPDIAAAQPAMKDGKLHIPDVPGLGLEWDEKAVAAHLADNFWRPKLVRRFGSCAPATTRQVNAPQTVKAKSLRIWCLLGLKLWLAALGR